MRRPSRARPDVGATSRPVSLPASNCSQVGGSASKVALPVAMPPVDRLTAAQSAAWADGVGHGRSAGGAVEGVVDDAVVGPAAALLADGEAGVDELLHVVRDGRLRQADRFGEVADARLAAVACRDQGQQPHPGRVTERLEGAAICSASSTLSTPPVTGVQQAPASVVSRGSVIVMVRSSHVVLTSVDASSSLDVSRLVDV